MIFFPFPHSLSLSLSLAVEGWVIFVSNLNEEVTEEEVQDKFADFGKVRDVRLNLDHRTGYVKGYALVEFGEYKEAVEAIRDLDGKEWLGNRLNLDFCFVKPN
jgi:RNA-binding protein 8A